MRKLSAREIVVASHNAGKVAEINELIEPYGFAAKSAAELGLPEPDETGTTFEENATIKALSAATISGLPALADDSGLCVNALDGDPGVYTADWAEKPDGSGRNFAMAMEKVEAAIKASGKSDRSAHFVSVLCMAWPDGHCEYFRGQVDGHLVWPPRGGSGFGYDPVFVPDGHDRTFSEMTSEEKHGWDESDPSSALSHRSRAFVKFVSTCLATTG